MAGVRRQIGSQLLASALLVLLLLAAAVSSARAHEMQPAFLELRQTGAETYRVLWKVPKRGNLQLGIRPRFDSKCQVVSEVITAQRGGAYLERYTLVCPGGIEGKRIEFEGPWAKIFDVLIRLVRSDGATEIIRVTPSDSSVVVRVAPAFWQAAATYVRLGVDHILMGVDHLLFVLGLLLIVRDRWMLLKTITSFTIAHSITLAIASLGYANAPLPPLNAAIALSILFLGPEAVRVRRGETSLTIAHPWVVAFAFGLLHGFGFASGLTALGLERSEVPLALLFFNVGVEIGQLFFVAIILLLERSFRILEIRSTRWAQALPAYTVGTLGAYWTIQRTLVLFHSLK